MRYSLGGGHRPRGFRERFHVVSLPSVNTTVNEAAAVLQDVPVRFARSPGRGLTGSSAISRCRFRPGRGLTRPSAGGSSEGGAQGWVLGGQRPVCRGLPARGSGQPRGRHTELPRCAARRPYWGGPGRSPDGWRRVPLPGMCARLSVRDTDFCRAVHQRVLLTRGQGTVW